MILFAFGLTLGFLVAGILFGLSAIGAYKMGHREATAIQKAIEAAKDKGHSTGYDAAVDDLAKLETNEEAPEGEPMMLTLPHFENMYQWIKARDNHDRFMTAFDSALEADKDNDARN